MTSFHHSGRYPVELYIAGERPDIVRDTRGSTYLHLAVEAKDTTTIAHLLSVGAKVDIARDDGETPLSLVFKLMPDREDIIKAFLFGALHVHLPPPPNSTPKMRYSDHILRKSYLWLRIHVEVVI